MSTLDSLKEEWRRTRARLEREIRVLVVHDDAGAREELERLKGRLRWLADRVAFSRITVTFQEVKADFTRPFDLPFRWLDLLGRHSLIDDQGNARFSEQNYGPDSRIRTRRYFHFPLADV